MNAHNNNEICRYESIRTFPGSSCLRFGWNVKNFAQNLLIVPDQHGGKGEGWSTVNSKVFADPSQVDCWLTPSPSINIVRGNPSKVFADPSQVDCWLTPQGSTLSEVILPKSSWIHSKLIVNWPPRINIVRGNPSKVFADPSQVDCQLIPQIKIVRGNPSKVFMDPSQVDCWLTPRINIVRGNPSKVFADPSQVDCQLTPRINIVRGNPSKVFADPSQVDCWLIPQINIVRCNPSKLFADPSQVDCWLTLSLCGSFLSGLSITIPTPRLNNFCGSYPSLCRSSISL